MMPVRSVNGSCFLIEHEVEAKNEKVERIHLQDGASEGACGHDQISGRTFSKSSLLV